MIGVVYERGQFAASDTEQTELALAFYCLGLVGYASTKVLAPAFYALDNVRIPMMISLFSIALNYTLNFVYIEVFGWGHWALALSTSLVATLNSILLFVSMRSQIGGVQGRRLLRGGFKISAASAVMGACCWICARFVEASMGPGTFVGRLAALLITVPVGVGLIYWLCRLLRVPELELARSAIMARLVRPAKPSG